MSDEEFIDIAIDISKKALKVRTYLPTCRVYLFAVLIRGYRAEPYQRS